MSIIQKLEKMDLSLDFLEEYIRSISSENRALRKNQSQLQEKVSLLIENKENVIAKCKSIQKRLKLLEQME